MHRPQRPVGGTTSGAGTISSPQAATHRDDSLAASSSSSRTR